MLDYTAPSNGQEVEPAMPITLRHRLDLLSANIRRLEVVSQEYREVRSLYDNIPEDCLYDALAITVKTEDGVRTVPVSNTINPLPIIEETLAHLGGEMCELWERISEISTLGAAYLQQLQSVDEPDATE